MFFYFPSLGVGFNEFDLIHRRRISQAYQLLEFFAIGSFGRIEYAVAKWL
jgi:hypothetical protein